VTKGESPLWRGDNFVSEGVPFIKTENISDQGICPEGVDHITPEVHARMRRSQLKPGHVVLSMAGTIGVAAVIPEALPEANTNQDLAKIVLKPKINPHYVATFLNSDLGRLQTKRLCTGTTRQHINFGQIKSIHIPVPDRPVQDAIADKMDAAYRRKWDLEAEAEVLLESIDGYVLGELGIELPELTEEKCFAQRANAVRGGRLDSYHYLPRFTQGVAAFRGGIFPLRPLEDLITSISGGSTPRGAQYPDKGIPFLRIQNIADGAIDLSDVKYISPETHKEMKRSQLRPLDLLMTITGRVGTCAVVPEDFGDGNINQHIVRMSVTAELDPCYAAEVLDSPVGRLQTERGVTGTTRIALDYPTILRIRIPVPPLGKQRDIAAEVRHWRKRAAVLQEEAERVVAEAKAEVEQMILGEGEG
jgi:restriction endonuclease S subunit